MHKYIACIYISILAITALSSCAILGLEAISAEGSILTSIETENF